MPQCPSQVVQDQPPLPSTRDPHRNHSCGQTASLPRGTEPWLLTKGRNKLRGAPGLRSSSLHPHWSWELPWGSAYLQGPQGRRSQPHPGASSLEQKEHRDNMAAPRAPASRTRALHSPAPAQEVKSTCPGPQTTCPLRQHACPVRQSTCPMHQSACPVYQRARPVRQSACPAWPACGLHVRSACPAPGGLPTHPAARAEQRPLLQDRSPGNKPERLEKGGWRERSGPGAVGKGGNGGAVRRA